MYNKLYENVCNIFININVFFITTLLHKCNNICYNYIYIYIYIYNFVND